MQNLRQRSEAATLWGQTQLERLEGQRPEHAWIEAGFRWILRDKEIAGGVLGGGLAYRFFFWFLALSVLTAGGLGFASRWDVGLAVQEVGLTTAVSNTIEAAASQSQSARWWLLLIGVWLTLWFSWGLLRALRLVHAAAWRITPPPLQNGVLALAAVIIAPVVLLAVSAGAGWVREHVGVMSGAFATVAVGVVFGLVWLRISMRLPAPDVPWTAFLPGAVLLGVGLEVLHVFTVYFLADKLASSSELYGGLGLAATLLFYLFLIGRGVIWAAELNAVVWEIRSRPAPKSENAAPA
jgi:uncharacterized BrkB/YihY/UPF0761 family membrane protein